MARVERDRYVDLLRAVAILRVIVNHAFPFAVLELIFPSMGVMFALGGSLMVTSIERSAVRAVRSRVRRLLPALWVMGAIMLPLMLLTGWADRPAWPRLLLWAVPLADPPANSWGMDVAGVLWYLVTYLWLVLLSPLLLRLYRRLPVPAILLPLAALLLLELYPEALGPNDPGAPAWVLTNVLTFASCWLAGFAHRLGHLKAVPLPLLLGLAAGLIGGSLAWAFLHPSDHGVNMVDIPLAYAVYALGWVLVLLRWSPPMGWLSRRRVADALVSLVNARAVTIYLWHNVAITLAVLLGETFAYWRLGHGEYVAYVGTIALLIFNAVLLLGWVEDKAARRSARLLPWPPARRAPRHATPAQPAPAEKVPAAVG